MPKETAEKTNYTSPEESNEFTYKLLTGHPRTDGSYKTDRQLHMEYIQLTDGLIHKMTDGLEVVDSESGEKVVRRPDTVIFLDKSARPLAWLTKELWDQMAPEPGSDEIPPMPDFKFLNIDREQWVNIVDEQGVGHVDVSKVDPGIIRSLRSVFVTPQHKQEGLTERVDSAPTELDGKNVMVVDEVFSSGRTLNIATQLIRRAFPSASIGGEYWMQKIATKGAATGNADLPVWYKSDEESGRGVGNRQAEKRHASSNITQRLGAWFLSTRFPKPDEAALQLRREFHELATHPDVPLRPSNDRDIDDIISRLEEWNHKPADQVMEDVRHIAEER